jgi:hypothetical protein
MQIGEQDLVLVQHFAFVQLRFFDLDEQLRCFEYFLRRRDDACACSIVVGIRHANTGTGVGFDHHFVTVMDEFAYASRHHADTEFEGFDFFWYADFHGDAPVCMCISAGYPLFDAIHLLNQ